MKTFGQGKRSMGDNNKTQLSLMEFSQLYGSFLARVEPLVIQAAEKGVQLEPDLDDIAETMGMDFRNAVVQIRTDLDSKVEENHKGAVDGYVKRILEDDFGPKSELAVTYGDQFDNALALLLPKQARKKEFVLKCWAGLQKHGSDDLKAKYSKMPAKSADIRAFKDDLLVEVDAKLELLKTARKSAEKGTEPKRSDFEKTTDGYQKYLTAKATFMASGKEKSPEEEELGVIKGAISWLTPPKDRQTNNRNTGTGGGTTITAPKPPTLKKQADSDIKAVFETSMMTLEALLAKIVTIDQAEAYVAAMVDCIKDIKGEETQFASKADYTNAGARQIEWRKLENIELPKLRRRVDDLKAKAATNTRLAGAAAIVVQAPDARGVVTSPVADASHSPLVQDKDDGALPDSLEGLVTMIGNFEKQFTEAVSASGRHYDDAKVLYLEAETLRPKNRAEAGKKDVDGGELEALGARAKQAADKIAVKLEALHARKAELEKVVTETPGTIAVLVATPVVETGMTLAQFVAVLRESDLSNEETKTLRVKAIKDLSGAIAEFTERTKPAVEEVVVEPTPLEKFIAEVDASDLSNEEKGEVKAMAEEDLAGAREILEALIA